MVASHTTVPRHAALTAVPAQGLCTQCRHADDCTFGPRLAGHAVRSCDEFEGDVVRPGMREVAPLTPHDAANGKGRPRLGLCANCDAWDQCTFPKPEGGVWSCDEYV